MKVFTDLQAPPELIGWLRESIAPHELLLPAQAPPRSSPTCRPTR